MKWSKKDYLEIQSEIVKEFKNFEKQIEINQQDSSFNEKSIDYLITRLLSNLTTNSIDGVKRIEYMSSEDIYKNIQSLEKLFNIKKLLDDCNY